MVRLWISVMPPPQLTSFKSAINDLVPVLTDFFSDASHRTGWHFSVTFGGPLPIAGGKIQVGRYDIKYVWDFLVFHHIRLAAFMSARPRPETRSIKPSWTLSILLWRHLLNSASHHSVSVPCFLVGNLLIHWFSQRRVRGKGA
jgi:hypothetical protein